MTDGAATEKVDAFAVARMEFTLLIATLVFVAGFGAHLAPR